MRSRKAGLPFATRARKRKLCLKVFLETTSVLVSCYPDHNEPVFKIRTRGFPFNVRQCPLMTQKTRPLSHRIQKGQDIGGYWQTIIMRIFRTRFWTQRFPFVMRSRKAGLPMQHKSVRVRQCPSESAIVRPSPPMSFRVRQCPSMSANVPKNTSVVS